MGLSKESPIVLVTRPEPGASATAKELSTSGFEVIVQPFTEMVGLPVGDLIQQAQNADIALVTSANALRYIDQSTCHAIVDLPLLCVGDATMEMAKKCGFKNVKSVDGDGAALIDYVHTHIFERAKLLYLCGVTRTPDIEQNLSKNYALIIRETYKTQKISQLTYKIKSIFNESPPDAILFYSSVSAEIFTEILNTSFDIQAIDTVKLFCISERARSKLPSLLNVDALVADKPRNDVMIKMVQTYFDGA